MESVFFIVFARKNWIFVKKILSLQRGNNAMLSSMYGLRFLKNIKRNNLFVKMLAYIK